jgi:hypothetical protein
MTEENKVSKLLNKRSARKRQRELDDIEFILKSSQGRRFFYRLFEISGIWRTSMSTQNEMVLFNEGQRNVGLIVLNDMMLRTPSSLLKMQEEFKSEAESEKVVQAKEIADITKQEE